MADINEQILRQLQELTDTVKSSRALNGGFEQLEAKVDTFSKQLDEIEQKMDAIQEPEKGLYARVKDLEAWQAITSKVLWGLGASVGSIIMMYVGHKFGVN